MSLINEALKQARTQSDDNKAAGGGDPETVLSPGGTNRSQGRSGRKDLWFFGVLGLALVLFLVLGVGGFVISRQADNGGGSEASGESVSAAAPEDSQADPADDVDAEAPAEQPADSEAATADEQAGAAEEPSPPGGDTSTAGAETSGASGREQAVVRPAEPKTDEMALAATELPAEENSLAGDGSVPSSTADEVGKVADIPLAPKDLRDKYKLTGIMENKRGTMALINSKVTYPGDMLEDNAKVLRIDPRCVVLKVGEDIYQLRL